MLIQFKLWKRPFYESPADPKNEEVKKERAKARRDYEAIPYRDVFINPMYVVSVSASHGKIYDGCTSITTCARESEEENESWIVLGKLMDVVQALSPDHGNRP